MISAGRVLPMPKGDYNALTTYEYLDIVSDNGNSYILKVDTSTGNPPTDTTKWQLLAYGGSAANVAANFAVVETTQYASQAYNVGDFLVDKDSKLCRVTAAILQGSEIIIGTNVEVTSVTALVRTVEESIAVVETKIASYSHDIGDHFYLSDVLYKATAAIQAGDTLTSGTNITPAVDVCTQINELASDTETAIQGVKDLLAPSEDGSTAVLSYSIGDEFIRNGALCKAKTAITSGDTLVLNTNYEDAGVAMDQLVSVNEALTNEVVTRAANGAHNLLPNNLQNQVTRGIQVTVSADGKISLDGELESQGTANIGFVICESLSLKAGSYKLSGVPSGGGFNKYQIVLAIGTTTLAVDTGSGAEFTLSSDTTGILCQLWCYRAYGDYDGLLIYPMIRLASDPSSEYTSYAMTNRELTDSKYNIKEFFATSVAFANYKSWIESNWSVIVQYPMSYVHLSNSDLMLVTLPSKNAPTVHAAVMVYSRDIATFERGRLSNGVWTWT